MPRRQKQPSGKAMQEALAIMRSHRMPVSENTDEYRAYQHGYDAAVADILALAMSHRHASGNPVYPDEIERGDHIGAARKGGGK